MATKPAPVKVVPLSAINTALDKMVAAKKKDKEPESFVLLTDVNVPWNEVIGLNMAKNALQEAVQLPSLMGGLLPEGGEKFHWSGILLFGPPGTGKTMLAKAAATAVKGKFISISASDICSKWSGDGEKNVRRLYTQARANAPCVIFIDEVDSLMSARTDGEADHTRRIKNQILVEMDGVGGKSGVVTICATNHPWSLDKAAMRRLEKRIYIPLPNETDRAQMLDFFFNMEGMPGVELDRNDLLSLAQRSYGFSGSDIFTLTKECFHIPFRRLRGAKAFRLLGIPGQRKYVPCDPGHAKAEKMTWQELPKEDIVLPLITVDDIKYAMEGWKKTVDAESLFRYRKWAEEFSNCPFEDEVPVYGTSSGIVGGIIDCFC